MFQFGPSNLHVMVCSAGAKAWKTSTMSWGMSLQAFIPCAPPPPLIRHSAELRRSFSTPLCVVVFLLFLPHPVRFVWRYQSTDIPSAPCRVKHEAWLLHSAVRLFVRGPVDACPGTVASTLTPRSAFQADPCTDGEPAQSCSALALTVFQLLG